MALAYSFTVSAFEASAIRPCLRSYTMLLVMDPIAVINATICTNELALAMSLVVEPHALVCVAVG